MADSNLHLSDSDLVMAVDGELSPARRAQVFAHLEACWPCRERKASIEASISGFVRARNESLAGEIPEASGPRALLRARLAEEARKPVSGRSLWRALWPAAAFAGTVVAVALVSQSLLGAAGPRPRTRLTPGEVRPITIAEVCRNPHADVVAEVSDETRQLVFSAYGIRSHQENFEVDYLITPDLGGAQSVRNLWPQPYSARWNSRTKDELEQRLHDLVCGGRLDLSTAQREIAADWIGAYRKYVGEKPR
jgi:hypothetical protein